MSAYISLGVAGSLGPDAIAQLAPAAERAGFHALWVNDTPGGDAVAALAAAARTTERLVLASGVVPVDRRPPERIVADVRDAALPTDRVVLGIGSGAARAGSLGRVAAAVERLRDGLGVRVVVGALGPRMRRLGAGSADGVVLNWLTAAAAGEQARELHEIAPDTHVALYVRTAVDPAARARLDDETARYASYPNYAANFARLGIAASDTVVADGTAYEAGLPAYRDAVDEVVLRAITPHDDIGDYLAFIDRTAPRRDGHGAGALP